MVIGKPLGRFLSVTILLSWTLMLHPVLAEEATPPGGAPPQAAEPKPDPAGVSTGDKTNVIDAGGNSFAVSEPSDKADPDYAKKKKDFEVYQTQAGKEPLATKLADAVGPPSACDEL